nr:MAG TPA: hypothetical protein [Caudoviricetes sp.]
MHITVITLSNTLKILFFILIKSFLIYYNKYTINFSFCQ